ncbi:hypothetical protein C8Q78DRAFT_1156157 [Trametes maxima]|nr:hypothetical protein C8Q78DRAFT_1156157 [Trametes maxima]
MSSSVSESSRPKGILRPGMNAYGHSDGLERLSPTPTAPDLNTAEGRVRENEARTRRNDERVRRREAGEANVGEDESLLDLTPEADGSGYDGSGLGNGDGTVNLGAATGDTEDQFAVLASTLAAGGPNSHMAAFLLAMKLEGATRDRALEFLNTVASAASSQGLSGDKYKAASAGKDNGVLKEGPELKEGEAGRGIHTVGCRLVTLLRLGFHLPLTLCTDAAIEVVQMKPSLLVCKNQIDANGAKVAVVEPYAGWSDEISLSSEEWKDAWNNFLHVLPNTIEAAGVSRFQKHFDYLRNQECFATWFSAILRFDIKIHHMYFWAKSCTPFTPDSSAYIDQLNQIRHDMNSTAAPLAATPDAQALPLCTPVLSAGPQPITQVLSGVSIKERIITMYRADAFEEELRAVGLESAHFLL